MKKGLILIIFSLAITAYAVKPQKDISLSGNAQGTTYHITYVAADTIVTRREVNMVFSQLDSSLSIYKTYSLINKFNNSERGVVADDHLSKVVKRALQIYKDTKGSFDITVYPLVAAWGFGNKETKGLPDSVAIRSILPCVGSQKLRFEGKKLVKSKPCVKIDVNGIAQGYSADVLAAYLAKHNIRNYIVEIGGEIRVSGRKANGELMRIGIEGPAGDAYDEPVITKVIAMQKGAITTSGNYRKYVESNGKRYAHLIDPKTGFPITGNMISATVIAPDGITADGYDNPLMAMSVTDALAFVKRHPKMEAYLIYHKPNGELADTASAGFYKLLVK